MYLRVEGPRVERGEQVYDVVATGVRYHEGRLGPANATVILATFRGDGALERAVAVESSLERLLGGAAARRQAGWGR